MQVFSVVTATGENMVVALMHFTGLYVVFICSYLVLKGCERPKETKT